MIDITFKFLRIIIIRETSKRKGVPLSGSSREEAVRVEVAVPFNCFISKRLGPRC